MKFAFLLLSVSMTSFTYAADQAPDTSPARGGACKGDIQQFCPNIKPGGGRIAACFKENKDQLSDACKAQIEKIRAQRNANNGNKDDTTDDSK